MSNYKVVLRHGEHVQSIPFEFESEELGIRYAETCVAPNVDVSLISVADEGLEAVLFHHDGKIVLPIEPEQAPEVVEVAPVEALEEVAQVGEVLEEVKEEIPAEEEKPKGKK